MSVFNPKRIVFESEEDVIDYVSRGLPPTKKNFDQFITAVKSPADELSVKGDGVSIPRSIFIECDNATMDIALRRVYANRIHNRNILLTTAGIIAGVICIGAIRSNCKKDDDVTTEHLIDTPNFDSCPTVDVTQF